MRLFPNIVLKHEGNMPFENDGLRGGARHPPPLAVILERHCPSMRSIATGNRFGDLWQRAPYWKRSPKAIISNPLKREENISFEDDG